MVTDIGPELYLIRNSEPYALAETVWELVNDHYWLRMIGVHMKTGEEVDFDLDLSKRVWREIRDIIEMYPQSRSITYILHLDTNKDGIPRRLESNYECLRNSVIIQRVLLHPRDMAQGCWMSGASLWANAEEVYSFLLFREPVVAAPIAGSG